MPIQLITVLFYLFLFSCSATVNETEEINSNPNDSIPLSDNILDIKIFKTDTLSGVLTVGYGFYIIRNNVPYIFQPTIPAITGHKCFASESDARKVAQLMVYKILQNTMPPSIHIQELDSMNIQF